MNCGLRQNVIHNHVQNAQLLSAQLAASQSTPSLPFDMIMLKTTTRSSQCHTTERGKLYSACRLPVSQIRSLEAANVLANLLQLSHHRRHRHRAQPLVPPTRKLRPAAVAEMPRVEPSDARVVLRPLEKALQLDHNLRKRFAEQCAVLNSNSCIRTS